MAKTFGLLQLHFHSLRHRNSSPLIVYQMGKVGSSSVFHSLKAILGNEPIYHVHTLQPDRIASEEKAYRTNFFRKRKIDRHQLEQYYLSRRILNRDVNTPRLRVITLVRDPVPRNISTFFQTLDLHWAHTGFADRIKRNDSSVVNDLMKCFTEKFKHLFVLSWFDRELKSSFGIDVMTQEFDPSSGYKIYKDRIADLLLIRMEDLNRCAPEAFHSFLGIRNFKLIEKNVSANKYYSEAYREFIERFVLPDTLLDSIYASGYVRKFYTPDEIHDFRSRWQNNRPE